MKKTSLNLALAGLLIAGAVAITSCKKKDATTTPAQDTSAGTAADNNTAEQTSNDVENIGAQAVDNGSLSTFRLAGGGTLDPASTGTYTITGAGTGVVTVTFSNYTGKDGHLRNGTLIYTITNGTHYRDVGMTMTIATTTANPYSVDGNGITLTKTVTNNGFVAAGGNLQWTIQTNLSVTKANGGGTFTWTTNNRTHVLLNTAATIYDASNYAAAYNGTGSPITWSNTDTTSGNPNGAIIQINGTASGTSADGVSYTVSTNNVVRNMNCTPIATRPHFHPFVAGTVDFTPTGKTTRIINYGSGACDLTYTISIGSWSETLSW